MKKRRIQSLCSGLALAIALLVPSLNAYAAEESYTVTFRPGNVGYFATSANPEGDKQVMAAEVAAQEYGAYSYEVTKNGAIKVTVAPGSTVPNAPTYVQAQAGYFVKEASSWGPAGGTVDRNQDYVVDYGKLVDGVEYTVKYVDSASGESIAPVYIAQANVGDTRIVTAPSQIVISGSTVYNLTSASTLSLLLDKDASKNVLTFSYTMVAPGTEIEEILISEDGEIITTTEYVNGTTVGGTTVVAGADAGAGAVAGGAAAGGAAAPQEEQQLVEIGDEETPLAGNASQEEQSDDLVNIGDEEVPLAAPEGSVANMALIGASLFAVAAVALAIVWLWMKKKRMTVKNVSDEE